MKLRTFFKAELDCWRALKGSVHRWDFYRAGLQWRLYFAVRQLRGLPVTPPIHHGPGPRYRPVHQFRGVALPGRRSVHWLLFPMVFEYTSIAESSAPDGK